MLLIENKVVDYDDVIMCCVLRAIVHLRRREYGAKPSG
jgi:hypothetical protein